MQNLSKNLRSQQMSGLREVIAGVDSIRAYRIYDNFFKLFCAEVQLFCIIIIKIWLAMF